PATRPSGRVRHPGSSWLLHRWIACAPVISAASESSHTRCGDAGTAQDRQVPVRRARRRSRIIRCAPWGSTPRPQDQESDALPTELEASAYSLKREESARRRQAAGTSPVHALPTAVPVTCASIRIDDTAHAAGGISTGSMRYTVA